MILEVDRASIQKEAAKLPVLRAVVRGRQANGELDIHSAGMVSARCLDLAGNRKQGKHEVPLVLLFVSVIGDALVREQIVFVLVVQHVRAELLEVVLLHAADKRLAVAGFD